jgi:hypothetical protein
MFNVILRFHRDPRNANGFWVFSAVNGTVIDDNVSRPFVSLIFWSTRR